MNSWIYVLHFDTPFEHAQHYVGCTRTPASRLITHARGHGARIVKAAMAAGCTWRLGNLYQCLQGSPLVAERHIKDMHGSKPYCGVCTAAPAFVSGCRMIDVTLCNWPLTSTELRDYRPRPAPYVEWTENPQPWELLAIREWMNADKESLGWIPCGGNGGIAEYAGEGQLLIARATGVAGMPGLLGYAAVTTRKADWVRVQQICVADAWRWEGIGRMMLNEIIRKWPTRPIVARVKNSLPAAGFWAAMGFEPRGADTHLQSAEPATHWWRAQEVF